MPRKKKLDSGLTPDATAGLTSMALIEGAIGRFEVFEAPSGGALLETDTFRLYIAKSPSGQVGLMKIAASLEQNEVLEREIAILRTMQAISKKMDAEAMARGEAPYNYGAHFPLVLDAVISDDERQVAFLGYHEAIASYKQLQPLSLLLEGQRIDLKTGTWIFGKLLKLAGFVHALGFGMGNLDFSNLLVETDLHGIFVLDWSEASEEELSEEAQKLEVARIAALIWDACGGNTLANPPVFNDELMTEEQHEQYVSLLKRMIDGSADLANEEHTQVYELADVIWPRKEVAEGIWKRDFHGWVTYAK